MTRFEMTLKRTYAYAGSRHSYLSAGCPAPVGLEGILFPFARAKFGFAGGNLVSPPTLFRDCTVR